jgi:hypothetical protein
VLSAVDLALHAGRVHSLAGENGEIVTGDPLQYTESNYKEHAY